MITFFKPVAVGAISALAALPFVVQAPAQAAACPKSTNTAAAPSSTSTSEFVTYSAVFDPNFSCTIGDKIFSNFKDPSSALASLNTRGSLNGRPRFWFSEDSANKTYNMFWGIDPIGSAIPTGTYDFTFDVGIDPLPSAFYIDSATYTLTGGTSPGVSSISIAAQNVLPQYPKLVTYTTSVTLGGGTSNTRAFKVGIVQDMVPGPLPIIGASVAFGYSRKLRRRTRMLA